MSEISANPYVGLRPYEMDESMLFFGRDDQTLELLQHLHHHHFVAIVGSSGCGKSSLLRAGLIPSLKAGYLVEDSDRWIIAIMKPGQSPLYNLSEALLQQIDPSTSSDDISSLLQKINEEGSDAILECLETFRKKQNINFFLLVDQFEELFRFSMDQKNAAKKDEAIDFVNILLQLTQQRNIPFYVVLTMRSDFIGDCDQFFGLPEAMNKSQYLVPRLNRIQMKTVIEGPVKLRGNKINSALTSRLLNELGKVKDELPLLQHALMRMWDFELTVNNSGELDLEDYKNIGGIENALSKHADEVLYGKPEEGKPGMNEEDMLITKKLFQALTEIDENGRKIRYPVKLSQLKELTGAGEEKLLSIIDLFIKDGRSFLIINKADDTGDKIIDISHESLIRQWSTLSKWVDEEGESASVYLQLSEDMNRFKKNKKYLEGLDLQTAIKWREEKSPTAEWAQKYNEDFTECMQFLKDSEKAWKDEEKRKINNRRKKIFSIATVTILVIAGLVFYSARVSNAKLKATNAENEIKLLLANNYWNNSKNEKAKYDYVYALANAAEAIRISNDTGLAKKILVDIENQWPLVTLNNIISDQSQISAASFSAEDSRVIVTASKDFIIRKWDAKTGAQIDSVIILKVKAKRKPINKNSVEEEIISFTTDNKKIITTDTLNRLRLSFVKDGKIDSTILKADSTIYYDRNNPPAFNRNGTKLIYFDQDFNVFNFYDFDHPFSKNSKKKIPLPQLKSNKDPYYYYYVPQISNLVFNRDATKFLFVVENSKIYIGSLETNKIDELRLEIPSATLSDENIKDANKRYYDAFLNHVSFTTEENIIITSGKDNTVRLWNVKNKIQIGDSLKHQTPVQMALLIPKTKNIFSMDEEGSTYIWDKTTGLQLGHAVKLDPSAPRIKFRSDGQQILVVENNVVFLWDLIQENYSDNKLLFNDLINPVLSPDLEKIAVSDSIGKKAILKLLNSETRSQIGYDMEIGDTRANIELKNVILDGQKYFSPDSKKLLTEINDSSLFLWDVESTKQIGKKSIPWNKNLGVPLFSPDSKIFITHINDTTQQLISTNTGMQIGKNIPLDSTNPAIYIASQKIIFSSDSSKILLHKVYVKRLTEPYTSWTWPLVSTIKFWDVVNGKQIMPDINYTIICTEDIVADVEDGDRAERAEQSGKKKNSYKTPPIFSSDGKTFITFFKYDSVCQIWDAEKGKQIGYNIQYKSQWFPFFSPDGKSILAAINDSIVQFFDAIDGKPSGVSVKHSSQENPPVFNQDGKRVITFQKNGAIQLIDVITGKAIKENYDFKHQNVFVLPTFSPDGQKFLTTDQSGFMRLWNSEDGVQAGLAMRYQKFKIHEMAFSPDSKKILSKAFYENRLSGGNEYRAVIWDAESGKQIGDGIECSFSGKINSSYDGKLIQSQKDDYIYGPQSQLINIGTGDLDIFLEPELLKLQVYMTSGYIFDFKTNEKNPISSESLLVMRKNFDSLARKHYKICRNKNYNFWRRFNEEEAKKLSGEKIIEKKIVTISQFEILPEFQPGDKTFQENNGSFLEPNQAIYSKNKQFLLAYQKDGDLVIYRVEDMLPIWSSETTGLPANRAIMQYDGNLVIYANGSKTYGENPIWSSVTYINNSGAYLELKDDGNLVIYNTKKVPVWQSYSNGEFENNFMKMKIRR